MITYCFFLDRILPVALVRLKFNYSALSLFLQLATDFEKSVPCDEAHLLPVLRNLLIERFGAVPKAAVSV